MTSYQLKKIIIYYYMGCSHILSLHVGHLYKDSRHFSVPAYHRFFSVQKSLVRRFQSSRTTIPTDYNLHWPDTEEYCSYIFVLQIYILYQDTLSRHFLVLYMSDSDFDFHFYNSDYKFPMVSMNPIGHQ